MPKNEFRKELRLAQFASGLPNAATTALPTDWGRCPHALRHARATHLLQQGASFKEIGDLLGHRSLESVGIYAKVGLSSLRAVADLDLGGLL